MSDLQDLLDNLKEWEHTLSKTALKFCNAIRSTGDKEKDFKLIFNILHDTLIVHENKKNDSASSIIQSCMRFLISKWGEMGPSILQKLPSLFKVSLQRICSVDKDITVLTDIGWDVLKYLILSKKADDDGVAKWFLYGASQFTTLDTLCSCNRSSSCQLVTEYIAEFQVSFVKLLPVPSNSSRSSVCGLLLTSFERHCQKKKFSKSHITSIIDKSFDILDKVSVVLSKPINCDTFSRKVITSAMHFGGHVSLRLKNANVYLNELSEILESICENSQCSGAIGLYLALLDSSLAILSKNLDFCQPFVITAYSFLRKVCCITGYGTLSNDQLLRLASFLHRTCSEQTLVCGLTICDEIVQKSQLMNGSPDNDDKVKFLGMIFSIGTITVNGKLDQKLYDHAENMFQNLLQSLSHETLSEKSKFVPIVANLGVVLVKLHRKYGKYVQAMKSAEMTIKMIPYVSSISLIHQWVKAKYSNRQNTNCQTLAMTLKGKVPDSFLITILMQELEMYVQLGMDASNICSVTTALLQSDQTHLDDKVSHILRHHCQAMFEGGMGIDFDDLLDASRHVKLMFEDVLEIKIIQFLQKWHVALDDVDCQKTIFDIDDIFVIASHLKEAVDSSFELKRVSETCKAVHDAYEIACVFGHHDLALQIIGSLYLLLQHQEDSIEKQHIIKLNICSTLCEMTSCYVYLNQIATAQIYADQALVAWDSFKKCVGNKIPEGSKSQLLYYKVQATQVKVLYLLHKKDEAKDILERCFTDHYLDIENVKTSVHALYCSCVVYTASYSELDSAEARMMTLFDLLKRLSSLRMTILPHLQNGISENNKSVCKTQRFGLGLQNMSFDLFMQLHCLSLLMHCLRNISKTYILLGDPNLAKAYIYNGTAYAKSLHLKNWYLCFSLFKLELASMSGHVQYSDVVKRFCEAAKCDCDQEKSWISINDDIFNENNDDYDISFNEDDIDNEVLGSSDADAILIPTKKIKILDDKSYSIDVSSTPKIRKRVISKYSKVLSFLSEQTCSCRVFSADESIAQRMQLGVIHANSCFRSKNYEEALNIIKFCLDAVTKMTEKSMPIDIYPIRKDQFWWKVKAELHITKAGILHATKSTACTMAECESLKKLINENGLVQHMPSVFKAKLHILFANFNRVQEKLMDDTGDIKQLNYFIDALSQPDEISSEVTFATPVLPRKRGILSAKNRTTSKTKPIRTQRKKPAVANSKENFVIYEDVERNKLPVPQFQFDRSPSPHSEGVYDINIQETQNIKITRKAARSRFKKKFGTTYTDEVTEKVRGRPTNKKSAAAKTRSHLTKSNVSKDSKHVAVEVDPTSNLEDALLNASSVGDFSLTKISAQALSQCHFRSPPPTGGDNSQNILAATYHMLSVGITTRSALNMYVMKMRMQSSEKNQDVPWNMSIESPNNVFTSLMNKETRLVSDLQELLPENWSVCVISVTEPTDNLSKILMTRLRKREIYHTQINQGRFFDILHQFDRLMSRNVEALKSCDRSYWWTQRRVLDEELKTMISSLPSDILGQYAGILLGCPIKCDTYVLEKSKLLQQFPVLRNDSGRLGVVLDSWHFLTIQQKLSTVKSLIGDESNETIASLARALNKASTRLKMDLQQRGHVILIPGKHVQLLPWESTPLLQKSSVTRMPSIDLLKHQLTKLRSSKHSVLNEGVDMNDVSYVLNPNGDLQRSEERIQEWFQHMKTWKGIVARVPDNKEWIRSITDFDLFIYCGHGSGDRYISGRDLQKVKTRAAALLMGCNSAKLYQDGMFEPNGIVLNYLISGAPCVVGCLWKVTDKDIDKYLYKLLEKWADGKESPVSVSAISAREGMKMPYINGAACVVYGLPIHCQASAAKVINALPKI